ncbi:sushi, von Willebrand factor type A, EGF and pentraxin domain-containing protein 1-like [Uloborus diversus]|uniref:sushi, von Willebrand factor type A, EGF and pentraxin domain-containing protein 1-like n=1 Tax=Uloborus diversus TaxID=327109 RepID=UPI00240A7B0D|nr:sushi, von Willebrand factor type A, EGF and pentraxin domain-containing protein 1-like [Uloborus diversus]
MSERQQASVILAQVEENSRPSVTAFVKRFVLAWCSEDPPPAENAFISRKSSQHGGTVTYRCHNQFEKKKHGNVTCLFGQWEGITPVCQGITTSTSSLAKEKEKVVLPDDRVTQPVSTSTDRARPASTSAAPTNTEILERNPECTCQYSTNDPNLLAYISGRKIESGFKINRGSTVTFGCQSFGYLKLIGQHEDVCAACGQPINVPRCDMPVEGDTVVTYGGDFSVVGINLLQVKKGGSMKFICYAFTSRIRPYHRYPQWTTPSEVNSEISYSSEHFLTTILDITSLSEQHSGQYTCGGQYLNPTFLNVRVVESKESCPLFSRSGKYFVHYEEDRASFHCRKDNQKLRGASVLLCDSNGHWSAEPPDCIDLECPDLIEGGNLTVFLTAGKKVGSKATFHCVSPQQLKGNAILECLRNGTWSAEAPTCVLPVCSVYELQSLMPELVYPVLENVDSDTVSFGSNFTLKCEDNRQITQPAMAICGVGGKWTVPSVACISGCGPFAKDSGSVVIVEPQQDFYRLGEQILLSCPPGLKLTKEIEVVMCFGGKWSEVDIPHCQ